MGCPSLTPEEKILSDARRREKQTAWRNANRERVREITRTCEQRRAAKRAIAEGRIPGKKGKPKVRTPEEIAAARSWKTKRYYYANLEKMREVARIREQAKRDGTFVSRAKRRLTEEEKRIVNVVCAQNRRARLRNNGGKHTKDDIIRLMVEQEGKCAMCSLPFGEDGYHVDHFVPLAKGGTNDPSNLKLLHPACNLKKGAKLPDEFEITEALLPAVAQAKE